MLETKYLYQPRGQGWCFRMKTPEALIGLPNPFVPENKAKPFGREIRLGLETRNAGEARRKRDTILGQLREIEADATGNRLMTMRGAMEVGLELAQIDDWIEREAVAAHLSGLAEDKIARTSGSKRAQQWHQAATGRGTPLRTVYERYLAARQQSLSKSSRNNLKTAMREFLEFAGDAVLIDGIDRRTVAEFVGDYLPARTSRKAPNGQGPATIAKKVSQLNGLWDWARKRGIIPYEDLPPWRDQAPSQQEVDQAGAKKRPYRPEETRKLLAALPVGDPLGDAFRVALLTGVRLEEVASLTEQQLDPDGGGYSVTAGKTENAPRYVPLVDVAREVIAARRQKAGDDGALFPEAPVRPSTGKRGGSLSQKLTRVRRKVLGEATNAELDFHSLRRTWRTEARRAGVDQATLSEMGGWTRGNSAENRYDFGLEREKYREEQKKVAARLALEGYLGEVVIDGPPMREAET